MAAGDPVRLGQSNVSDINTSIQTNQNSVELLGGRAAFQAFCNPTNQNQRTRGVMGRTFSVFNAPPGASATRAPEATYNLFVTASHKQSAFA